jgi:hypothetical protein
LLPVSRLFRKRVDSDDFRPFQEMRPAEQVFALLWYFSFAIGLITLVLREPKAIDYDDFRQFLLLACIVFLPVLPVTLRREVELFREAGKSET